MEAIPIFPMPTPQQLAELIEKYEADVKRMRRQIEITEQMVEQVKKVQQCLPVYSVSTDSASSSAPSLSAGEGSPTPLPTSPRQSESATFPSPSGTRKPSQRKRAEPLTIAYMAVGAVKAWTEADHDCRFHCAHGQLEFVEVIIEHALLLDRLADQVDAQGGFAGVFCYEVAEPFGYKLGLRTINNLDLRVEELAADLIKDAS